MVLLDLKELHTYRYKSLINNINISLLLPQDDSGKKPKRKAAHYTLFKVQWERIILDEGHTIKNPKTNASLGVCGLISSM